MGMAASLDNLPFVFFRGRWTFLSDGAMGGKGDKRCMYQSQCLQH